MTGSASTGRIAKYHYYHCSSKCGYRIRAEVILEKFLEKLKLLDTNYECRNLYKVIVCECYDHESKRIFIKKANCIKSIEQFTERISKAKNLLLDDHVSFEDYQEIKKDLEEKIAILGTSISIHSERQIELANNIRSAENQLAQLDVLFSRLDEKQKLLFLNLILVKGANWEEINFDQIFDKTFRSIYDPTVKGDLLNNNQGGIVDFFKNLAKFELSI